MIQIPDDFYKQIDKNFISAELSKALKPFILPFLRQNSALCKEEGIYGSLYHEIFFNRNPTKKYKVQIFCLPFLSENLVEAFREYLPKEVRTVMDALTWEEHLHENVIKETFGIEVAKVHETTWGTSNRMLKKEFDFFKSSSEYVWQEANKGHYYTLSLLPMVRKYLIQHSPKPKNYNLHPTELQNTSFTFNGEKDIFLELPRLIAYYNQGNIKLTAKDRPMVSSVNKMQRTLKLSDFFEDTKEKILKNLRSNALISMLTLSKKLGGKKDDEVFLKRLFHLYRNEKYFFSFPMLHTTIKGTGHLDLHWDLEKVEPEIFKLLQSLPQGEWVSYQNIEDFVSYRMLPIQPVSLSVARNRLYFSVKFENSYTEKHYVTENSFSKEVVYPFLKGSLFLFAAFGLVEIAYNEPDTYQIGGTCFSPYDGLQFVKLTDLGAYVFGKTKEYEKPVTTHQMPLVLSKDSLMVLSDETDTTADILLQNYTQKVGANRYLTDAAIFLKNCKTKTDLENKINLFQQTVTDKLPPNWQAFFKTLLANTNPLKKPSNYTLMQIPPNNNELIRLIAQDVVLKKYVLKAEEFHILVKKSNLAKFKNRLKEFGFLLS